MKSVWSPVVVGMFEELLEVRPLLSYKHIAAQLSETFDITLTKNAAIGFAKRRGVPKRQPPQYRKNGSPVRALPHEPKMRVALLTKPVSKHVPGKVLLQHLTAGDCRWPEGNRSPFLFCGMPTLGSMSYCRTHCLISYPSLRGRI